ncbi:MAG: CHAP domain-containing protein [Rhodospirillales bacterium]|nr:MAG: CHAP domain-containing protein [Rhodospirillales bacterium]
MRHVLDRVFTGNRRAVSSLRTGLLLQCLPADSRYWRLCGAAVILFGFLVGVGGCASKPPPPVDPQGAVRVPMQCVPFAREVSQVQIRGNAADWWSLAEGRYQRSAQPEVGSVLVFRRSARLPHGHVAVVSSVLADRYILVTHANWVRDQINEDAPVIDVSPGNDWSEVRVWWPPSGQMGRTVFPTFGFIAAGSPPGPDQIAGNTRRVIQSAVHN